MNIENNCEEIDNSNIKDKILRMDEWLKGLNTMTNEIVRSISGREIQVQDEAREITCMEVACLSCLESIQGLDDKIEMIKKLIC